MVFEFFKASAGQSTVESVQHQLVQMLRDGLVVYDEAMDALFGAGKSKETKRSIKSTDREINLAEQDVRRDLMMHVSVQDAVDLPLVLAYMSVVKDVERVGDYAKNVYDLVKYGEDFSGAADLAELTHYRNAVAGLIEEAAAVFESSDSDRAAALIAKADGFLDEYDARVRAAYNYDGPASQAVARALYYRYLKRITSHVMNLMTALVMPIDRLDYYDEAKDDRVPPQ